MGSTYVVYGTQTAFGYAGNLGSLATTHSCGIGEVAASNCWGYEIDCQISTNALAGTSGYIQWYLIQSPSVSGSSTNYTDGLSPSASSAAVTFYNAIPIHRTPTPAVNTSFYDRFWLPTGLILFPFWTLFAYNGTANNLSASNNHVNYTPWYGSD